MNNRNKKFKSINTRLKSEMGGRPPPNKMYMNFEIPKNIDMHDVEVTLVQGTNKEISGNVIKEKGSRIEVAGQCTLPIPAISHNKSKEFLKIFERKRKKKDCMLSKMYSARLGLNGAIADIFKNSIMSIEKGKISKPNVYLITRSQYAIILKTCKLLKTIRAHNTSGALSCRDIFHQVMANAPFKSCKEDVTVDQCFLDSITRMYEIFGRIIQKYSEYSKSSYTTDSSCESMKNFLTSANSSCDACNSLFSIDEAKMHWLDYLAPVEAVKKFLDRNDVRKLNFNNELLSKYSSCFLRTLGNKALELKVQLNGAPTIKQEEEAKEDKGKGLFTNPAKVMGEIHTSDKNDRFNMMNTFKGQQQISIRTNTLQIPPSEKLNQKAQLRNKENEKRDKCSKRDKNTNTKLSFFPAIISEFSMSSMQSSSTCSDSNDIFTRTMKIVLANTKQNNKYTETELNVKTNCTNTEKSYSNMTHQCISANIKPLTKEKFSEISIYTSNKGVNTEMFGKVNTCTQTNRIYSLKTKINSIASPEEWTNHLADGETWNAMNLREKQDPLNINHHWMESLEKSVSPKRSKSNLNHLKLQDVSMVTSIDTNIRSYSNKLNDKLIEGPRIHVLPVTGDSASKTRTSSYPPRIDCVKNCGDVATDLNKYPIIEKEQKRNEISTANVDAQLSKLLQSAGPLSLLSHYKTDDGFMYLNLKLTTKLSCKDNKCLDEILKNSTANFGELVDPQNDLKIKEIDTNSLNVTTKNRREVSPVADRREASQLLHVDSKHSEEHKNFPKMGDSAMNTEAGSESSKHFHKELKIKTNERLENKTLYDKNSERSCKSTTEKITSRLSLNRNKSKSTSELVKNLEKRDTLDELYRKLYHYKKEIHNLMKNKKDSKNAMQNFISTFYKLYNVRSRGRHTCEGLCDQLRMRILSNMQEGTSRRQDKIITKGLKETGIAQRCSCSKSPPRLSKDVVKQMEMFLLSFNNCKKKCHEKNYRHKSLECSRNHASKAAHLEPEDNSRKQQKDEQHVREMSALPKTTRNAEENTQSLHHQRSTKSAVPNGSQETKLKVKSVRLDEYDLRVMKANIGEYLLKKYRQSTQPHGICTDFQVNYCSMQVAETFDFNRYIYLAPIDHFPFDVPETYVHMVEEVPVVEDVQVGHEVKPEPDVNKEQEVEDDKKVKVLHIRLAGGGESKIPKKKHTAKMVSIRIQTDQVEKRRVIPARNMSSMPKSRYYNYPEDMADNEEVQRTERVLPKMNDVLPPRGSPEEDQISEREVEITEREVPITESEVQSDEMDMADGEQQTTEKELPKKRESSSSVPPEEKDLKILPMGGAGGEKKKKQKKKKSGVKRGVDGIGIQTDQVEMPGVIPPRNMSSMPKSRYYNYPEDMADNEEVQRTERVLPKMHDLPPAPTPVSSEEEVEPPEDQIYIPPPRDIEDTYNIETDPVANIETNKDDNIIEKDKEDKLIRDKFGYVLRDENGNIVKDENGNIVYDPEGYIYADTNDVPYQPSELSLAYEPIVSVVVPKAEPEVPKRYLYDQSIESGPVANIETDENNIIIEKDADGTILRDAEGYIVRDPDGNMVTDESGLILKNLNGVMVLGEDGTILRNVDTYTITDGDGNTIRMVDPIPYQPSEISLIFEKEPELPYVDRPELTTTEMKLVSNIGTDADGNIIEMDEDGNILRDAGGYIVRDENGNLVKDADGNVVRNPNGILVRDAEGNILKDADGYIVRDAAGNIVKDAYGNPVREVYPEPYQPSEISLEMETQPAPLPKPKPVLEPLPPPVKVPIPPPYIYEPTTEVPPDSKIGTDADGNIIEMDKDGNILRDAGGYIVRDENGNLIRDADGNVIRDPNGILVRDTEGNILMDADGYIVRDAAGNIVKDADGNPVREVHPEPYQPSEISLEMETQRVEPAPLPKPKPVLEPLPPPLPKPKPVLEPLPPPVEVPMLPPFIYEPTAETLPGANIGTDADGNIIEMDEDGNILRDAGGYIVRDENGNLIRDADGNVVRDPNGILVRDEEGNILRDADGYIVRDAAGNIVKDTDGNPVREVYPEPYQPSETSLELETKPVVTVVAPPKPKPKLEAPPPPVVKLHPPPPPVTLPPVMAASPKCMCKLLKRRKEGFSKVVKTEGEEKKHKCVCDFIDKRQRSTNVGDAGVGLKSLARCICGKHEIEQQMNPELVEKIVTTFNQRETEKRNALFLCWALARVLKNKNGTKRVEIVEVSANSPGHYFVDNHNKLHVLTETLNKDHIKEANKLKKEKEKEAKSKKGKQGGEKGQELSACLCEKGGFAAAESTADRDKREAKEGTSFICWAILRIMIREDGTKDVEIVDVSNNPPGHFYVDSQNKLHIMSEQQAKDYNKKKRSQR